MAQAFIQTTTAGYMFPDMLKEYGHGKLVDLRCGFSKTFLSEKFKDELNSSQIKFKEGNIIDFGFGMGCGLFVQEN